MADLQKSGGSLEVLVFSIFDQNTVKKAEGTNFFILRHHLNKFLIYHKYIRA